MKFYVHHNGAAWFVKEGAYFEHQGGLVEDWGRAWRPLEADSVEDARTKAAARAAVPQDDRADFDAETCACDFDDGHHFLRRCHLCGRTFFSTHCRCEQPQRQCGCGSYK